MYSNKTLAYFHPAIKVPEAMDVAGEAVAACPSSGRVYTDTLNQAVSQPFSPLSDLPLEILFYILKKFIDYKTVVALQQTCHSLRAIYQTDEIRLNHHLDLARTHWEGWHAHYNKDTAQRQVQIEELWGMLEAYPLTSSLFRQAFQLLQLHLPASSILTLPVSAELEKKFCYLMQSLPFPQWWIPPLFIINYAKTRLDLLPLWFGVQCTDEQEKMLVYLQQYGQEPLEKLAVLFNVSIKFRLYSYLSLEKLMVDETTADPMSVEQQERLVFAQQIRFDVVSELMKQNEVETLYALLSQSTTFVTFLGDHFQKLYFIALEQNNIALINWLCQGLNTHPQYSFFLNEIFYQAIIKGYKEIAENLQAQYMQQLEEICTFFLRQVEYLDGELVGISPQALAEGYLRAIESTVYTKQLKMYGMLTERCPSLLSQQALDRGCIAAVRMELTGLAWAQLAKGADINRCYQIDTFLSSYESADLFTKAGKNSFTGSQNALIVAAEEGNLVLLQLLVLEGAQITVCNNHQHAALSYAIESGKVEAVKWLMSKGANMHLHDVDGATPLIHAVKASNNAFNMAETWENEIDNEAENESDDIIAQRLHYEKRTEASIQIIALLLEQGANINARDEAGNTPLMYAAIRKNRGAVSLLLDKGADASIINAMEENALFHWLHWLPGDYNDGWALEMIAEEITFITRLIDHGASIHQQSKLNNSHVLHRAATAGATQIITYLLQCGADPTVQDAQGNTILHLAVSKQRVHTLHYLILHGLVNIGQQNLAGETVLHLAFADLYAEDYGMIHFLLAVAGTAIYLPNAAGKTIREMLEQYKDELEEEIYLKLKEEIEQYSKPMSLNTEQ